MAMLRFEAFDLRVAVRLQACDVEPADMVLCIDTQNDFRADMVTRDVACYSIEMILFAKNTHVLTSRAYLRDLA